MQLQLLGLSTILWTELAHHWSALYSKQVCVFYRQPCSYQSCLALREVRGAGSLVHVSFLRCKVLTRRTLLLAVRQQVRAWVSDREVCLGGQWVSVLTNLRVWHDATPPTTQQLLLLLLLVMYGRGVTYDRMRRSQTFSKWPITSSSEAAQQSIACVSDSQSSTCVSSDRAFFTLSWYRPVRCEGQQQWRYANCH